MVKASTIGNTVGKAYLGLVFIIVVWLMCCATYNAGYKDGVNGVINYLEQTQQKSGSSNSSINKQEIKLGTTLE